MSDPCFVMQHFVPFLVVQFSRWRERERERESWLLYFNCFFFVVWLLVCYGLCHAVQWVGLW